MQHPSPHHTSRHVAPREPVERLFKPGRRMPISPNSDFRVSSTSTGPARRSKRRREADDSIPLFPSPPRSQATLRQPNKRRRTDQETGGRQHVEEDNQTDPSRSTDSLPPTTDEPQLQPADPLRPAAFWDNLSRIPLTPSALKEFNRRTRPRDPPSQPVHAVHPGLGSPAEIALSRLARHGGPDLSDLRGFDEPEFEEDSIEQDNVRESGNQGDNSKKNMPRRSDRQKQSVRDGVSKSQSKGRGGSRSGTRSAVEVTTPKDTKKTKSSSPYDAAFKQHLIDYQVWPINHYFDDDEEPPVPDNLQDITRETRGGVNGGRASLEPSSFTPATFKRLRKAYNTSTSEEARSRTLDAVEGEVLSLSSSHQKRGPVKTTKLTPLTLDNLVPGNPDRAYGSRPEKLRQSVRQSLAHLILPTAAQDIACPNFIVHVKGPNGDAEVAKIQAVYDGAFAARGMEALWSLGNGDDQDDRNLGTARTITCTIADGVLRMYAVYVYQRTQGNNCSNTSIQLQQTDSGLMLQDVEYSTTYIGSWMLYDELEGFREGAAAFRNGLEWARRQRNEAIERANVRADATHG